MVTGFLILRLKLNNRHGLLMDSWGSEILRMVEIGCVLSSQLLGTWPARRSPYIGVMWTITFSIVIMALALESCRSLRLRALATSVRHYAISTWIEAGLTPKTVQTLAGHSSLQVTMDRYGHLFPSDDHKAAMDAIAGELMGCVPWKSFWSFLVYSLG